MKTLTDQVAVVAGASRGAGRGIALALGDAGATVYVTGRTRRGGPKPPDGAPGTIDDTAEEVTVRGGRGVPVRVDFTVESEVVALFERVQGEQGRLDVLVNAVWGGHDAYPDMDEWMATMKRPFWTHAVREWDFMMTAGPYAYLLASCYASRLMAAGGKGLIVGITDGHIEGAPEGGSGGPLIWDLAHRAIDRLMEGMSAEGKKHGIAFIALMPGFMRTERILQRLTTDELKKTFGFDKSESTEYVGRAVAALAADEKVLEKTGKVHYVADLAQEYGFTDVDGRWVPRFDPFG
jgi:NAD(P)-dependent dehydrogenase (short-subunit alcohol dehydrogenase family)